MTGFAMNAQKKAVYAVSKLKDFSVEALDKEAARLLAALEEESAVVRNEAEWKACRDRWMARAYGLLTQVNDLWLKAAPKDAKRDAGQRVNQLKKQVEDTIAATLARIEGASSMSAPDAERVDITLPGNRR